MKPLGDKSIFPLGLVIISMIVIQCTGSFANISATANTFGSNSAIQHVIIIIMENKGYSEIIGSPDAPYQNELAKKYSSASKYFGVYPDSLPNYISIIAGYPYLTKDKDPGTMTPL